MIKYTPITRGQIGLICRSIELGSVLQKDFGQRIVDLYRQGSTLQRISEEFDIPGRYDVGIDIARAAVFRALAGHTEGLDAKFYEGLMPPEERIELGKQHKKDAGDRVVREKLGVHGLPQEERDKIITKASAALTPDKRILAGHNAAISRGFVPFGNEEIAYIMKCRAAPEYDKGHGIDNERIAREVNQNWHDGREVRNGLSVYALAARIKKLKERLKKKKAKEQAL